jgi:dolichyl-phosphate-mannose-protein mannosyltransferase
VTSAVLGKAEPGRDIFAGEPVKEIKSDTLVVDRKQAPEELEKEISSVVASPATTALGAESNQKGKENDNLGKKNSETSTASSTGQDLPAKEGVAKVEKLDALAGAAAPGPLGEAEVEAQKAAEELFPEAA